MFTAKEIDANTILIDGVKFNIKELAYENDVDPIELRAALMAGPDSDGRFSPFSHLNQLGTKTKEQLAEIALTKTTATGEPLFIMIDKTEFSMNGTKGYIERKNQDTTAYNYTGNAGASGTMPWLGSFASHRYANGAPYIPYNKKIYLDRFVWLPDGVGYISEFTSNDTGAGKPNTWWVDIYYHNDVASARAYGVINLTYNQET